MGEIFAGGANVVDFISFFAVYVSTNKNSYSERFVIFANLNFPIVINSNDIKLNLHNLNTSITTLEEIGLSSMNKQQR